MKYFSIPNLPDRQAKGVVTDYRISAESIAELKRLGIEVFKTTKIETLYDAVCGHTDMQLYHLGENRFISAPEVYGYYKLLLPESLIIKGSKSLSGKYPHDVPYNAVVVGNYLICNAKYTAPEITENSGKTLINTAQGYAKCSVCAVGKNAVITSDDGIYNAAKKYMDVLKIEPGYIRLNGVSYGFIGGATGLIAPDILAVNGDIKTHPDCGNITAFCKNHRVDILSLKKNIMEDVGSIIPIF